MSAVYLLPTLRQEKSVPEEIFSDTPKQIHDLSYTLSHFTNPNRTLFIPNPSGALLRRKRNAKGNAASGTIGECRRVRLGSATLTFMSRTPHATRRICNLEPLTLATAVPNKRQCRGSDPVARKRSEDLDTKRSPVRVHRLAELGLSMGVGWRSFCTPRLARRKTNLPNVRWARRDRNVEQGGEHQAHKAHVGEFTC